MPSVGADKKKEKEVSLTQIYIYRERISSLVGGEAVGVVAV